jgi:hypothetical protein
MHGVGKFPAHSEAVQAIENNGLFHCFRNALLGQDPFGIPQSADAGSGKSPAPEMNAGTMHTHIQAYSAIICTVPSQEHHTCSFPDIGR